MSGKLAFRKGCPAANTVLCSKVSLLTVLHQYLCMLCVYHTYRCDSWTDAGRHHEKWPKSGQDNAPLSSTPHLINGLVALLQRSRPRGKLVRAVATRLSNLPVRMNEVAHRSATESMVSPFYGLCQVDVKETWVVLSL